MTKHLGYAAWRTYTGAPIAVRAFLLARLAAVPVDTIARQFDGVKGSILSVGSGHGLIERAISIENPEITVRGYELNAARVNLANATSGAVPNVELDCQDVTQLRADDIFEGALACDLFHHLSPEGQVVMAAELRDRLSLGGRLVVKDIARTPAWKHRWNFTHDRIVARQKVNCLEPEQMSTLLENNGFEIEKCERLQPMSPYPHYLIVATRLAD